MSKNLQRALKITTRHPFVGEHNQSVGVAWIDEESFLRAAQRTSFVVKFIEYRRLQPRESWHLACRRQGYCRLTRALGRRDH